MADYGYGCDWGYNYGGATEIEGTGAATVAVTASATGTHGVSSGTADATLALTAAASGVHGVTGTGAAVVAVTAEGEGAHGVAGTGAGEIAIVAEATGEIEIASGVTGAGVAGVGIVGSAGGLVGTDAEIIGPPLGRPAGSVPYYPPIFDFEEPKKKRKPKPVTGRGAAIISLVAEAKGEHTAPVSGKASVVINVVVETIADHGESHYEQDNAFFILAA